MRTVNIKLKEQEAGIRKVRFLPDVTPGDDDLILNEYYSVMTDANGLASIDLPTKATGTVRYKCEIPNQIGGDNAGSFYLAAGGAVDLEDLLATGVPATETVKAAIDDAIANAASGGAVFQGLYPNATFPAASTLNSANGHNDLYTVPAGRKALVIDYIKTNSTGGAINSFPEIKIGSTYYQLGNSLSEVSGGIGHNYGMTSGNFSQSIVLNAGEKFSVNCDAPGLSVWVNIIEFDAASPLGRADIQTWVNGANTLFTVPVGKTVSFGATTLQANSNNPGTIITSYVYRNTSGSSRTISTVNIVPSGGSPAANNQFVGSNVIFNGQGFNKYFHGNMRPGDFINVNSDSNAAGQYAWINYVLR